MAIRRVVGFGFFVGALLSAFSSDALTLYATTSLGVRVYDAETFSGGEVVLPGDYWALNRLADGDLLVSSGSQVLRFDAATLAPEGTFISGPELQLVRRIEVADAGIYVSDDGEVLRYDAAGLLLGSVVQTTVADFAIGPDGALWIVDSAAADIRRYDPISGALLSVFASSSNDFSIGGSLFFTPDGAELLAWGQVTTPQFPGEPAIARYDVTTGAQLQLVQNSSVAFAGGTRPGSMAFGPDGDLYSTCDGCSDGVMPAFARTDPDTLAYLAVVGTNPDGGARALYFTPEPDTALLTAFGLAWLGHSRRTTHRSARPRRGRS